MQIAAAAMAAEMPVERLAEIEFAYPNFTRSPVRTSRSRCAALAAMRAWQA